MDRVGDPGQRRDESVLGQRDLALVAGAAGPGDADRPHDDHRSPAACTGFVVTQDSLAAGAVLFGEVRAHRRHEDPVAQLEPADAAGCQQVPEGSGHGATVADRHGH
jgi:hypothetical protein